MTLEFWLLGGFAISILLAVLWDGRLKRAKRKRSHAKGGETLTADNDDHGTMAGRSRHNRDFDADAGGGFDGGGGRLFVIEGAEDLHLTYCAAPPPPEHRNTNDIDDFLGTKRQFCFHRFSA